MFDSGNPADDEPDELVEQYLEELAGILDAQSVDHPDVPETIADTISRSAATEISLTDAAAILALRERQLDAEAIQYELRDQLLIEMSNAVVDVETLAANTDLTLSGTELQQRIEGRAPINLAEYAQVKVAIAARTP